MPDFKKFAGSVADAAAGRARNIASFAARKTKNVSRIAKLNVDIAAERDTIKRVYREIGKLYYETRREDPESYFAQLCQEIDLSMESIAAMEAEIVRLKTQETREPREGVPEEAPPIGEEQSASPEEAPSPEASDDTPEE